MALAALAAALAIAIAGCGGGDGGDETATTTPETTTDEQPTTTTGTGGTTTGGGSGDGQVGSRHSQLGVVDAVLTSADPAKACGADYVTKQYLNAAYGGKQGCIQAQSPRSAAKSLQFSDVVEVQTHPPRATLRVIPEGGLYGGEQLTVTLVRDGGGWKVDAIESNAPVGP